MALVDFQIEFPPQGVVVLRSQHLSSSSRRNHAGEGREENLKFLGGNISKPPRRTMMVEGGINPPRYVSILFGLSRPGTILKGRPHHGGRGVGPKADVVRDFA